MSCSKYSGSNTTVSFIPNPDCRTSPVAQRLIMTVVPTLLGETATIGLDPAFVPAAPEVAYTAATRKTLYKGTSLYFGAGLVRVIVAKDTILSTTAAVVPIEPASAAAAALAANSTALSYLAGKLCLDSKNIAFNPQSSVANEDCGVEGEALVVNVYTAYTAEMALTGFPSGSMAFWTFLNLIGQKLGRVDFYQNISNKYGRFGTGQLTPAGDQNNASAQLYGFTGTLAISKITNDLPKSLINMPDPNTGVVYTAAAAAIVDARRALWGYQPLDA